MKKGEEIDRFCSETGVDDMGNFLSPAKTPYGERSLPYDASKMKQTEYEVVIEIEVNSGKASPWFGEKGGGIQHQTDMSVGEVVGVGKIDGRWTTYYSERGKKRSIKYFV